MTENQIATIILDCAFEVHRTLGPGLFESVYEEVIAYELTKRKLGIARQVEIPMVYESIKMEAGFRADIIVEKKVIIELKSVEILLPVHNKQLPTYLTLTDLKLGLRINFNEALLKNGIVRIANNL